MHTLKNESWSANGGCAWCEHCYVLVAIRQWADESWHCVREAEYPKHTLTKDERAKLVQKQSRCLLCNKSFKNKKVIPVVDHSHKTGEIRGILCSHCNLGLGHFRDDIHALARAIQYLTRN